MLFDNHNNGGAPQLISSVLLEDKPGAENNDNTPINEISSTSSPQIPLDYNTVAPSQSDSNSNINLQDAISVTDVPIQNETPDKQIDDSIISTTDNENYIPVTTANIESIDHKKPIENPVVSDQSSENEKPTENDQSENKKPSDNNQSLENDKPTDNSEVDITTISYVDNVQTATNNPETSNNFIQQTTLLNILSESQDYLTPSTIANIIPANDQNQPDQNSELDDSVTGTTNTPKDSLVDQQVNEQIKTGVGKPPINEEFNIKPSADITELPAVDINPVDTTQIPTIVADEKPTINSNNVNRPTSIDDIISSVNMVKDAIKNSLETSSKPAEIDYQTTFGVVHNDQPTAIPGESGNPLLEGSLPNIYNEPQTTVSSANSAPDIQTDVSNEKLPENLTPIETSDELEGTTRSPYVSSSANVDQEVSTNSPLNAPDKQEILSGPNAANSNVNVDSNASKPEGIVDDKLSEVTTAQYLLSSTDQNSAIKEPEMPSTSKLPQVNVESSTNIPGIEANDKISEIPSAAQQEVHVDDLPINESSDQEKPANTETLILPNADVNTHDVKPTEVVAQTVNSQSPIDNSAANNNSDDNNKNDGEPNSSLAPHEQEENKRPQYGTDDMVQIPFDTEKPSSKPSSSTPFTPTYSHKPPYTQIPQSTWTPKPFHQDSTSETPQPDQGFADEYDDENEAVFGPGTCR